MPRSTEVAVTLAPETAALDGSVTLPEMVAVTCWPQSEAPRPQAAIQVNSSVRSFTNSSSHSLGRSASLSGLFIAAGIVLYRTLRARQEPWQIAIIYMGDGKFINATTHLTPMVRIDDLNDAYWTKLDRKSTRLNSSHLGTSYAVFC